MRDYAKYCIVHVVLKSTSIIQQIFHTISSKRFPPFCSALALIENDNKYLVLHHKIYKQFTFPGGYVRLHENPAIAVKREIKEETGLDVEPEWIVGAYQNRSGVKSINIIYKCTGKFSETIHSYEGKCEWLAEDVFYDNLCPHCRDALNDYKESVSFYKGAATT